MKFISYDNSLRQYFLNVVSWEIVQRKLTQFVKLRRTINDETTYASWDLSEICNVAAMKMLSRIIFVAEPPFILDDPVIGSGCTGEIKVVFF